MKSELKIKGQLTDETDEEIKFIREENDKYFPKAFAITVSIIAITLSITAILFDTDNLPMVIIEPDRKVWLFHVVVLLTQKEFTGNIINTYVRIIWNISVIGQDPHVSQIFIEPLMEG